MTHLVKTTSKGQVTLPMVWRKRFHTNRYTMKEQGNTLVIAPLEVESLEEENWKIVFDANRDNNGKAIPIAKFMNALKKTL